MSTELIESVNAKFKKPAVLDIRTGDVVKVHQRIKEGDKERLQVFSGTVIKTARSGSVTSTIWVRKVSSGIGVERSFLLHSPLVEKIEITARGKVRRNFLSYLRERSGKSARLTGKSFDREAVNMLEEAPVAEEVTEAPEEAEATAATAEAEVETVIAAEKAAPDTQDEVAHNPSNASAEPAE